MRKVFLALLLACAAASADSRPKVRAVTAFVDIDAKGYSAQIGDTMRFLNSARDAYKRAGFDVETVRIVTQPFPRYIQGMKREDALALFHKLNDLASSSGFSLNIGAAMIHDNDDASLNGLLADALSTGKTNASLVIAGEDGIHWRALREAAKLIHEIAQRSAHGEGNFNFAATAMVKPYGPFFPGAYHLPGGTRTFAVGLEGANVVYDVFAQTHDPVEAEKRLADTLARYMREAETVATGIASSQRLDLSGNRPHAGAAGRCFDRPRHRSLHRRAVRFERNHDGRAHHHAGGAIRAGETHGVLGADGAGAGGFRTGEAVGGRNLQHRFAAGLFGGVRGRIGYGPATGDTSEDHIARILSDVASLAQKWNKPLAARLLPVPGKKAGDRTEFTDSRMANTVIH